MKRIATQVLAVTLAIILLLTLVPVMALATGETATETVETVWNGGDMAVNVTAGKNGYTHLSVYTPPYHAYEMSNHMVTAGETNSIPQTLVMIDATEDYTWTPDGPTPSLAAITKCSTAAMPTRATTTAFTTSA